MPVPFPMGDSCKEELHWACCSAAYVRLTLGTWLDYPRQWQPQELRLTDVLACCPFRSHQHTWVLSPMRWHIHIKKS